MKFYTYDYLVQQTHTVNKIQWAIMFVLFVVLLIMGFLWLRRRLDYRLKEVGILIIVLLLLLGGIQLNTYNNDQASDNQYAQTISTLQSVAKSLAVSPETIQMNRTDLTADPIIKTGEHFYLVHLSDDKATYVIEEIKVKNYKEIERVDVGGQN